MEQTETFKRNSIIQDLFTLTSKCVDHCKTINKNFLSSQEINCLENCGFNKTFLSVHMKDFVENATWGDESSSPFESV